MTARCGSRTSSSSPPGEPRPVSQTPAWARLVSKNEGWRPLQDAVITNPPGLWWSHSGGAITSRPFAPHEAGGRS